MVARARRMAPLLLLLAACGDPPPRPGPEAPPSSTTAATPVASAPSSSASASALNTLRPPASSASREEREKAAIAILAGRAGAADLPLSDVDQGEVFEPRLRLAMSTPMEIKVGSVVASGLDEAAVRKAVEKADMRFRVCYAGGLRYNPNLQGRVQGRIRLASAGKASAVTNGGSDVPDSAVVRCVLEALGKIDFPAPQAPVGLATVEVRFSPY